MNLDVSLNSWQERAKRNTALCNLLLLQFKKPVFRDLTIPSSFYIHSLVGIAIRVLNGQKINPLEVNCCSSQNDLPSYLGYFNEEMLNAVFNDTKFSDEFYNLFDSCKDDNSVLDMHMILHDLDLRSDFIYGHGTWYTFREGRRAQISKDVRQILSDDYRSKLNLIGRTFQPYISRVHAPGSLRKNDGI